MLGGFLFIKFYSVLEFVNIGLYEVILMMVRMMRFFVVVEIE